MARQNKLNTPEKRARVGERIKVAATQAGLSLKELAEQAEVSPSAIYQYVRGITAIPLSLLERIAAVTQVHNSFFDPAQDARQMLALPVDMALQEGPGPAVNEAGTRARIDAEYRQIKTLSDAHISPHQNRTAYGSALEQMLALSRALENREREAGLLAQMGQLRMQEGDYAAAQSSLLSAREIYTQENAEGYVRVTLDLANALIESRALSDAREYLEEIAAIAPGGERWRIELALGRICFRMRDNVGALTHYGQAAEAVLAQNSSLLERSATIPLITAMAQLSFTAGHFGASLTLWSRAAQQAEQERNSALYIEAMTHRAQCLRVMGRLQEAAHTLEIAAALSGFLADADQRQCRTRALLADTQLLLGAEDKAAENGRVALRIGHRTGKDDDCLAAELAMAEICLSSGQWKEALDYTQTALDAARRHGNPEELSRTYELRARAYLHEYEMHREKDNAGAAQTALNRALTEARSAVEATGPTGALLERIGSRLTLAQVYLLQGVRDEAQRAVQAAMEIIEAGPSGVKSLLNTGTSSLLSLLSIDLDLPSLFQSGARLDVPLLEWRAQYLLGTLASVRKEKEAAYFAFRAAALILCEILSGLTLAQALAFQKQHPFLTALLDGLSECADTNEAKEEGAALIESIARLTEQNHVAVVFTASAASAGVGSYDLK